MPNPQRYPCVVNFKITQETRDQLEAEHVRRWRANEPNHLVSDVAREWLEKGRTADPHAGEIEAIAKRARKVARSGVSPGLADLIVDFSAG